MGVLLGEGHDDVPEVGQGLVDVLGLGQPHPLAPTFLDPLAAGKINLEMKLIDVYSLSTCFFCFCIMIRNVED